MTMPNATTRHFDAFISYSHRADDDLAPPLRAALHRLAKPWYRTRSLRIFLDEAAMSAEPGLWPSIVTALEQSGSFILLLSPAAAASQWVGREITQWTTRNNSKRLLLVLTEGELVWDADRNDFDLDRSTAVPLALSGVFEHEPRHVDMRWCQGRTDLTLKNPQFLDAIAELAAPLHGVSKDDLVGSDLREHRRTLIITRAVAALLSVLLVASVLAAFSARSSARRAEQRRVDAQAVRLRSESVSRSLPADLAYLLAAQAFGMRPTAENQNALVTALQRTPDLTGYVRAHTVPVVGLGIRDDGRTIVSLDSGGELVATDARSKKKIARASVERLGGTVSPSADGVVVGGLGTVELRDWSTLAVRRSWTVAPSVVAATAVLPDGRLVIARLDGTIAITPTNRSDEPKWVRVQSSITAMTVAGASVVLVGERQRGEGEVALFPLTAIDAAASVAGASLGADSSFVAQPTWRRPLDAGSAITTWDDARVIVTGTRQGVVTTLNAETGTPTGAIGVAAAAIRALGSAPPLGDYVLAVTEAGDYRYVDIRRGISYSGETLHTGAALAIAVSPSGVAATGGADGVITLLDTVTNRVDTGRTLPLQPVAMHLSPDASTLATASRTGEITISTVGDGTTTTDGSVIGSVSSPAAVHILVNRSNRRMGEDRVAVSDTSGNLVVLDGGTRLGESVRESVRISDTRSGTNPIMALRSFGDRIVGLRDDGLLQIWQVTETALVLTRTISDRASAFDVVDGPSPLIAYYEIGAGVVVVRPDATEVRRVTLAQSGSLALAINESGDVAFADATRIRILPGADGADGDAEVSINSVGGQIRALSYVDGGTRLVAGDNIGGMTLIDPAAQLVVGRFVDEDGLRFASMSTGAASGTLALRYERGTTWGVQLRSFDPLVAWREGCELFGRAFTSNERARFDLNPDDAPCDRAPAVPMRSAPTPRLPHAANAAESALGAARASRSGLDEIAQAFATPDGGPDHRQETAVVRIATQRRASSCVRSALLRTPWSEFSEVARTFAVSPTGASFLARFLPIERACANTTAGGPAPAAAGSGASAERSPDLEMQPIVAQADIATRWNDAISHRPNSRLVPITQWGTVATNPIATIAPGSSLVLATAPDGSVSTVTLTLRPVPDIEEARDAAAVLAEVVDSRWRADTAAATLPIAEALQGESRAAVRVGHIAYAVTRYPDGDVAGSLQILAYVTAG
jgi:WD40 repeat protein